MLPYGGSAFTPGLGASCGGDLRCSSCHGSILRWPLAGRKNAWQQGVTTSLRRGVQLGQSLDNRVAEKLPRCPVCGANPSEPCLDSNGQTRTGFMHDRRRAVARAVEPSIPAVERGPGTVASRAVTAGRFEGKLGCIMPILASIGAAAATVPGWRKGWAATNESLQRSCYRQSEQLDCFEQNHPVLAFFGAGLTAIVYAAVAAVAVGLVVGMIAALSSSQTRNEMAIDSRLKKHNKARRLKNRRTARDAKRDTALRRKRIPLSDAAVRTGQGLACPSCTGTQWRHIPGTKTVSCVACGVTFKRG